MRPLPPAAMPDRQQLRQQLIARREALDSASHQRLSAALCAQLESLLAQLQPTTLGFCWPHRKEADILPLVTDWLRAASGRRAALPVVETTNSPLKFRQWLPGDVLQADRYGIPTPVAGDWLAPDLLLIPVNGFDARGYRLGYGGGYFDRTLAAMRPAHGSVGIGFELARVDAIPALVHDQPLDWIVTEKGAFRALQQAQDQR